MRIIPPFAVLAAFGAVACANGATEPSPLGDPLTITAEPATDTSQVIYIGNQHNLIYLSGRIATPDPCYDLSAYRTLQGSELRVTIVATRGTQPCAAVISRFDYQVLTDRPDCPHLTVWYHYEGTGWPDRKLVDQQWPCASAATAGAR